MDAPLPGGLGGTYAGNPLAVAAAHAVIDVIAEQDLCGRSARLGARLVQFLENERGRCPGIAEVRGLGSMVAIEFYDRASGKPDADAAKRVQQQALEQGLILLTCGVYGNVIRFLYPLTISDNQFEKALGIIENAFATASA